MEGSAVLDVEQFPEISYRSTAITKTGDAHWEVRGNLNLHGKSPPVVVAIGPEAYRPLLPLKSRRPRKTAVHTPASLIVELPAAPCSNRVIKMAEADEKSSVTEFAVAQPGPCGTRR
jgi:hypothetical protein